MKQKKYIILDIEHLIKSAAHNPTIFMVEIMSYAIVLMLDSNMISLIKSSYETGYKYKKVKTFQINT